MEAPVGKWGWPLKFPVGADVLTFTREGAEMYEVWDMVAAERHDTQVTKML